MSDLIKLGSGATNHDALCAFLYYHGLITYKHKSKEDAANARLHGIVKLTAPNEVARQEILHDIMTRFNLNSSAFSLLKQSLLAWRENNEDPSLFFKRLSEIVLTEYHGNDVVRNEPPFIASLHTALLLCQEYGDVIEKEVLLGDNKEEAIDIIYETPTTVHCIEGKALLTSYLFAAFGKKSWTDLTNISRRVANINDTELLATKTRTYEDEKLATISSRMTAWEVEISAKYGGDAMNLARQRNKKVILWLAVRVGLHRIMYRKVQEV